MEWTLWTTKEKPISLSDYVKGWKRKICLNFIGGIFLSFDTWYVRHDGTEYFGSDHVAFGLDWSFEFGYSCHYYDGYWKRLSFGPIFTTWFSMTGKETDNDDDA